MRINCEGGRGNLITMSFARWRHIVGCNSRVQTPATSISMCFTPLLATCDSFIQQNPRLPSSCTVTCSRQNSYDHWVAMTLQAIKWDKMDGKLEILDQTLLPATTHYIQVKDVEDGWKVIHKMQVSLRMFFRMFRDVCQDKLSNIDIKYNKIVMLLYLCFIDYNRCTFFFY